MKMTSWLLTISVFAFMSCIPKEISDAIGIEDDQLSTEEVALGLKEALEVGIKNGANALAELNGYYESPYKILLPEDARDIANKISGIPGFGDFEENLTLKVNRAAEDAAKKAAPIFVDAIKKMTIRDAWDILKGKDDAATMYLKGNTWDPLYNEFNPVISNSLDEVGALNLWESGVTAYNKIPFVKKKNPDLDDYVTNRALDGLFAVVAKEEKKIREEPAARVTDLLKKVFSRQD